MLDRVMCTDIPAHKRAEVLSANCDSIEEVTYSKSFSSDELTEKRVELEHVSVKIDDLEEAKKDYLDMIKTEMKPLLEGKKMVIKELKEKAATVKENCYRFLDEETRMVGYYNAEGLLVYSRPATVTELQKTIQMEVRTGTHG